MMKYRKKPEIVDAITFDEFVAYGKKNTDNIVNGMPWSFEFRGYPITHENDNCYIIAFTKGDYNLYFTSKDMLIIDSGGKIHLCGLDRFKEIYEYVPKYLSGKLGK